MPPQAQSKLVRVVKGSIFDVIVDLRRGSATCGAWEGFTLADENHLMLYVPRGFAHGFCTLAERTEVVYKADNYYSPQHDSGIVWNDPDLAIRWPVQDPVISEKDRRLQRYAQFQTPF
jgi:dTDP-4-dehydrorhamnose 3,5-epimerase